MWVFSPPRIQGREASPTSGMGGGGGGGGDMQAHSLSKVPGRKESDEV